MENLAVFFSDRVLDYQIPPGVFEAPASPLLDVQQPHPESSERIANIRSILQRGPLRDHLSWHGGDSANDDELLRFHTPDYLAKLEASDKCGERLTNSTYLTPGGLEIAKIAVGQALAATRYVLKDTSESRQAYALIRPASHHAAPDQADGYCFLNATALAALEALNLGCERVAIIDWDTHHGNGAQEGFYDRDDILTVSLHMDHGAWGDSHQQTGSIHETGDGQGDGYNLNIPLPFGAGDHCTTSALKELVCPVVRQFNPDLIIIANGQDANAFDPNGRQRVTMKGFHDLGRIVRDLADEVCGGRLVMVQEGGYNAAYAPFCAYATVAGCLKQPLEVDDPLAFYPDNPEETVGILDALKTSHPCL